MQLGITELDTEMFHRVLDTRLFRGQKVGFTKHKNIAGMGHDALVKSVATGWSGVDMSTPPPFPEDVHNYAEGFLRLMQIR